MVTAIYDDSIGKIIVKSDDVATKALLEYRRKEDKWCCWTKSFRTEEVIDKLYDNPRRIGPKNGIWTFEIGRGWAAYLAQLFKNKLRPDYYKDLLRCILADSYRTLPFPGLRDYQNDDVLHLMKYRFGLMSVNTSYGKTQVIATLANYFYKECGKKVLLITPGKKAKDELVKRYRLLFNENLPDGWEGDIGIIITQGLMQKKIVKDPTQSLIETKKLEKFEVVLVDEVEYTMNPGGFWVYDRTFKAERVYGFSGSADRFGGECISFANGINSTVMNNKNLIKYFGPSLVHRMPVSNIVNNITIKTTALDFLEFGEEEINEDDNVYCSIMNSMWTNPGVCQVICKLIEAYPKLYIPINNLETIIGNWVENWWKGKYRVLVICHAGYLYYDLMGNMTSLSLDDAVEMMRNNAVDVIPTTSSGFRALDFPGLQNMLMIAGKNAGVVLQTLGRTARMQEMNIIHLEPKGNRWIPVYTKGVKHRDKMLKEYYNYCKINDITINEEDLKNG